MSIELPRSPRPLHFTGSVKSLAPERPANALGQERPRASPPPSRAVPRRSPHHGAGPSSGRPAPDVYAIEMQPTPYVGARPSERAEAASAWSPRPSTDLAARAPLVSIDEEDIQTQHLDRDEIDAALFPVARRDKASGPAPNLPVPHFRSAAEARQHHAEPTMIVVRDQGGTFPLGVWLFAAIIAGMVSFQLAPQAMESVSQAVRAFDGR